MKKKFNFCNEKKKRKKLFFIPYTIVYIKIRTWGQVWTDILIKCKIKHTNTENYVDTNIYMNLFTFG